MREQSSDRDECGRAARLLALLDDPARDDDVDPASALPDADCEWLAQHLDACTSCAIADDAAVAPLFAALRAADRAEVPDEASFAAQRRSILSAIGAGAPEDAPARAPVLQLRERVERPRRSLWLAAGAALAATLVAALLLPEWRDRDLSSGRSVVGVPPPADETTSVVAAIDPAELADAEDAWLVASGSPLDLDVAEARGRDLGALTDDELDEVEGVFISVPGWS